MNKNRTFRPDRVQDYFRLEWFPLMLVTVSGLIYNVGLVAGPWFEGKLAATLLGILQGQQTFHAMLVLAVGYVIAIGVVQGARYVKRFYVRRFANNVNRRMKETLYACLLHKTRRELEQDGAGNIITKAISDVDDCAEGMRKFTTEVFDTGVALVAYVVMLLVYDWRLTLLCLIFPPISYVLAEKMKVVVQRTGAAFKEKNGKLSAATMDRVSNAITYRVYGCEAGRAEDYETTLSEYEKAAVSANVWNTALPPLYKVISLVSVLFILYFGAKNITGTGWRVWDIAAFTTFLSCFMKLSVKSSKAAKLFNSVQKAQVSWKRIKPYLQSVESENRGNPQPSSALQVRDLSFAWPQGERVFGGLSFEARPGQIIGITGPVACGKSTLGKVFLCEAPYEGSVRFGGAELQSMNPADRRNVLTYLGHDPELLNDSIKNNILLGKTGEAAPWLKLVCLDREVDDMPEGENTLIGSGGVRLSGGQGQRLALARTLCWRKSLLVLDDPFSALDRNTENEIFSNLKEAAKDGVVLLISHRLTLFPQMDGVIWMENGRAVFSNHARLMETEPEYAALYNAQKEGSEDEE